jgi:aspartyl-tRNA(Asn)/glutamyl-tRNA(Gln) amidotransferase subunit A
MHPALARHGGLRQLAEAVSAGRQSAIDIAEASAAAHRTHGETLNAYLFWDGEELIGRARSANADRAAGATPGPLHGLPVSVKDCIGVGGMPTMAGTARRLPAKWESEGPLVARLNAQRAVITGKTCQTEFALGATGRMPYGPQPRNPWDADAVRSAGGSSTGAALSLIEGSAIAALGTDTLGSVRIPASVAGVVGFRPGIGFWPSAGVVPLSPTFDTVGVLAWSVADLVLIVAALSGSAPSPALPSPADLRLALIEPCWSDCDASVAAVAMAAVDELAAAGAGVTRLPLPEAAESFRFVREGSVAVAEFNTLLESELPEWRALLQPATAALAARGAQASATQYLLDRRQHAELAAKATARLDDRTVLALPTLPVTPPRLADIDGANGQRQIHLEMIRHVSIASCLKMCAITLPAGLDREGIPVGLELMAPAGEEARLLSVAMAAEKIIGEPRRRLGSPPLAGSARS